MSFFAAEPKRKVEEISGGSSATPAATKKLKVLTEEQALFDLRKDWTIVKLLRNKDQVYEPFLHDKEFVKSFVGLNGSILKYLPSEMRDDEDVVEHAILALEESLGDTGMNMSAIQWASDRLKHDVEFIKTICQWLTDETEHSASKKKKIFSYLSIDIVKQVEPVTPYLLEYSCKNVDDDLFQSQISILPAKRGFLLKTLFASNSIRSNTNIFKALVDGSAGEHTLRRILNRGLNYDSPSPLGLQICDAMVNADIDLETYKHIMSGLRGIESLAITMSTSAARNIVRFSPNPHLMEKLMYIAYGNVNVMTTLVRNTMKQVKTFSISRRLSFNQIGLSAVSEQFDPDSIVQELLSSTEASSFATLGVGDLLLTSVQEEYVGTTDYLLRHSPGSDPVPNKLYEDAGMPLTLLSIAVTSANLEMARVLLRHGANVNDNRLHRQRTVLMLAPNVDILKALFDDSNDDNKPSVNQTDSKGCTALYIAASYNRTEVVKELLRKQALANIANIHRRTPIFRAVTNCNVECVRMLLDPRHGVDVNFRDYRGNSVLHHLTLDRADSYSADKVEQIFRLLVARGVDLDILNAASQTPLAVCGPGVLRKLLIDAGAGAKLRLEKFRRFDADALNDSPVVLQNKKDVLNLEDRTNAPVRCTGIAPSMCRHVFSGPYIHHWFNTLYRGRTKEECPICRQKIYHVEILSTTKAQQWDSLEKQALEEEKRMEGEIKAMGEGPIYRQLVAEVEQAKQKLKEAEQQLGPVEGEMRDIRAASDAKQSELRSKQIIKEIENLTF